MKNTSRPVRDFIEHLVEDTNYLGLDKADVQHKQRWLAYLLVLLLGPVGLLYISWRAVRACLYALLNFLFRVGPWWFLPALGFSLLTGANLFAVASFWLYHGHHALLLLPLLWLHALFVVFVCFS